MPALGAGANRWYVRQVARYVLGASWQWGAAVFAILASRSLADVVAPMQYTPHVIALRSAVMSYALIATYAFAASRTTWRSGHLRGGILVAFVAALISAVCASASAVVRIAIWHDPQTLEAIRNTGGLDEMLWGVPLELIPIGLICGIPGALVGKALRWTLG